MEYIRIELLTFRAGTSASEQFRVVFDATSTYEFDHLRLPITAPPVGTQTKTQTSSLRC